MVGQREGRNSEPRRKTRQANEEKHKFHAQRGDAPLNYTDLKDLVNIIPPRELGSIRAFLPERRVAA